MNSLPAEDIKNWIPWRLVNHSSNPMCQWLYAGDKSFTEPFFGDTISVCRNLYSSNKGYKVVSDLQVLSEWTNNMEAVAPAAIIFHVSRCGSTLLSQLLGMDDANIVLSEVPFFDELLRIPFKKQPAENIDVNACLIAAIKCYGQKRTGKEDRLFIKTDSWHLHFYPRLRTLFPLVPFILMYRNPFEVILSQQRQRGMQSVPGIIEPEVFDFTNEQTNQTNLDQYMTNVLTGYFNKMIEITMADPLVLPVNYKEGINSIMEKIAAFVGLNFTKETEKLFEERSRYHAKHPKQLFEAEKADPVTPAYLKPVLQLYEQLDQLRVFKF